MVTWCIVLNILVVSGFKMNLRGILQTDVHFDIVIIEVLWIHCYYLTFKETKFEEI